jgi:hypothetical protein
LRESAACPHLARWIRCGIASCCPHPARRSSSGITLGWTNAGEGDGYPGLPRPRSGGRVPSGRGLVIDQERARDRSGAGS